MINKYFQMKNYPNLYICLSYNDPFLPKEFSIGYAYPNPFNPTTTFDIALPAPVDVHIEVFNVKGQRVDIIHNNKHMQAGFHKIIWDGQNFASGMYLVRARLGDKYSKVRKVILFK